MLKVALKFVRPKIIITTYLIVFLGSVSVGPISIKSVGALFVLIAWYIHAASSNDYADRKIDAINLHGVKNRPLVTKSVSHKKLWIIHSLAGIAALVLSMIYGVSALILTTVVLLFDYAYSFKPFRITDRGAVAQFLLPIAYVVYPFNLGYWSVHSVGPYPWLLLIGLYCGFIARLFLKDFRDVKGDKKFGKHTFLIRHGSKLTCIASGIFGFISLLLILLATHFSFGILIGLLCGNLAVNILLRKLNGTKDIQTQLKIIATIAKIANISVLLLLIYYASSTYLNSTYLQILLPLLLSFIMYIRVYGAYRNDIKV